MFGLYGYLLVALIAAGGAWEVQGWRFKAHEATRLREEQKDALRRAEHIDVAAVAHEKAKVRIETKYEQVIKEVPHEVEKLVYRNVCVSPDGVRNLNDLIDTYDAGQSAPAVPEAGTPSQRDR